MQSSCSAFGRAGGSVETKINGTAMGLLLLLLWLKPFHLCHFIITSDSDKLHFTYVRTHAPILEFRNQNIVESVLEEVFRSSTTPPFSLLFSSQNSNCPSTYIHTHPKKK